MVSDANDKNEEDNQEETVDQAKDKEKEVKITLYDNGIPEKCAEKMVTEMFKDWMEQKPTWLYRRNLDVNVELRQYQSLSQGNFFFSWQNGTLSFFFGPVFFPFLLPKTFDFSTSKDFSMRTELPRVNFVKCAM